MVYATVFWLNTFPESDGISNTIRPWDMLKGMKIRFYFHFLLKFREYLHTHEDNNNSIEFHKLEALSLHPTGNSPWIQYILNLQTCFIITQ